jgi:3-oxoacyl-[acyl-carrier-protein] synthase II
VHERETTEATLRALIEKTLSLDTSAFSSETALADLGIDSLELVELVMAVEDAFGVEISEGDQASLRTIGDVATFVEARQHGTLQANVEAAPVQAPDGIAIPNAPPSGPATYSSTAWRASSRERVTIVVTGVGAITPLGLDATATFDALSRGESGVASTSVVGEPFETRIAAEVRGFDAAKVLGERFARRHARFTHFACAAALEAWRDAGLEQNPYDPARVASLLGVGFGGLERVAEEIETLRTDGPLRVSPFSVTSTVVSDAPSTVASLLGLRGPSWSVASACASGAHALATALDLLRSGRVDVVVAGGAEAVVTPSALASFSRMGALSRRNDAPERASRPFDRDRDGFVLGEGAGVLVLETLEGARARGARIYAEFAGAGMSVDGLHESRPDREGRQIEHAMRTALDDAGLSPEDIGYLNAHATGTPLGDRVELDAFRRVFGKHASGVAVGATKSMTGHLLGAAGAVEAIVTVLALARGVLPPNRNLESPESGADIDWLGGTPRHAQVRAAMSNSFGFGGQNASLVFRESKSGPCEPKTDALP